MISRSREWAARLLLIALSLIVALACCELWLRSFDRPWGMALVPHPASPRLACLPPSATGVIAGVPVRTNASGYRGAELDVAKAPGTFRIALLGDSMTFGWGVRDEETFAVQLAEMLADAFPDRRWEVENFAMIGSNTAQQAEAFALDVAPRAPDLVLVGFFMNDVDPPVLAAAAKTAAPAAGIAPAPRRASRLRVPPLRTVQFVKSRGAALARRFGIAPRGSAVGRYADTFAARAPGWLACEAGIRTLATDVRASGGRFGVVVLPFIVSLDDSYPLRAAHEQVVAFCASAAIEHLDLLPAFLGKSASALSVTPLDNHMNAAGHAIAARAIFDWISRNGMIGDAP
ncbi:MAG: SGNH/GDSL hydrolase family protein [bacterium]